MKVFYSDIIKKIGIPLLVSLSSMIFFLLLLETLLRFGGYLYMIKTDTAANISKGALQLPKILCLGDSYTVGGRGRPTHSYPQLLQDMLDKEGKDILILNGGICESNSSQVLGRLLKLRHIPNIDYVIILTGSTNRYNLNGFNYYQTGRKNYKDYIKDLRVYKILRILVTNIK
jgi:hypothetical protein